jgi:hypothetical protein
MARRLALVALAVLLLSGCSAKAPAEAAGAGADGAMSPDAAAMAPASFAAPVWKVGQWWEWQTTFGTATRDETFCSIVVGVDGGSYAVATERDGMAKEEAAFSHPLLGSIGKSDLAMSGWGDDPWSLLSFPLTDGKTWTATMPNIAWDSVDGPTVDLAMTARFSVPTPGEAVTVSVEGKVGDATLAAGIYDPSTGWFRDLSFFDNDPGQEGVEVAFHAKSTGTNYTGPIVQATATPILSWSDGSGFDDVPTSGGQPFVNPNPYSDFAVQGGDGHLLYGVLVAETVVGARAVVLTDPNGQERHFEAHAASTDSSGSSFLWLDEPAIAGTWRVGSAGAGGYSAAYGQLYEVVVTESAL